MGNRLHVARLYRIEYSDYQKFNWKIGEFKDLMEALQIEYSGEYYDDNFEILKDGWKEGIQILKSFDSLEEGQKEEITEALESLEYDREEVIRIMEEYLKQSDPEFDWLEFSFF